MSDFYDYEEIIGEVEKDNGKIIRIKKVKFNGEKRVDIREYYYNSVKKDYYPTKKGMLMTQEEFEDVTSFFDLVEDWFSN